MYKNNRSILGLTKGRCKFTTSDFPAENPRRQNRTFHTLNVITHTKHPVIKQGAKNNIEKNLTLNCLKNLIVSQK